MTTFVKIFFTSVFLNYLCCLCTLAATIWYSSLSTGSKDSNWVEGGSGNVVAEDDESYCFQGTKCYSMSPDSWIYRTINAKNYISVTLKLTVNLRTEGEDYLFIETSIDDGDTFPTEVYITSDTSTSGDTYDISVCDGFETCLVRLFCYSSGESEWSNEVLVQNVYAQGILTTPSPTYNPSTPPTKIPTILPTKIPSILPTEIPTIFPTKIPTILPTKIPTILPTKVPTILPTKVPTILPSKIPTILPTKIPTILPTKSPAISPTKKPTKNPTFSPTKNPTILPTIGIFRQSVIKNNEGIFLSITAVIIISTVILSLVIIILGIYFCRYVVRKRKDEEFIMSTFVDNYPQKSGNIEREEEHKNNNVSEGEQISSINSNVAEVQCFENIVKKAMNDNSFTFSSKNVVVKNENGDENEINKDEENVKIITTVGSFTETATGLESDETESSDSNSVHIPEDMTLATPHEIEDDADVDAIELMTVVNADTATTENVDNGNANLLTDPGLQMNVDVDVDFIMDDEAIDDIETVGSLKR